MFGGLRLCGELHGDVASAPLFVEDGVGKVLIENHDITGGRHQCRTGQILTPNAETLDRTVLGFNVKSVQRQ